MSFPKKGKFFPKESGYGGNHRQQPESGFTPSPVHSDADVDHLVDALGELWSHCALSRVTAAA